MTFVECPYCNKITFAYDDICEHCNKPWKGGDDIILMHGVGGMELPHYICRNFDYVNDIDEIECRHCEKRLA